jgi:membrane-associated protease RseP (regulator of RpoE activity)
MSDSVDVLEQAPAAESNNPEAAIVATQVQALLQGAMAVDSVTTPAKPEVHGLAILRGRLLAPSEEIFPRLLAELNARGYTPLLRPDPEAPAGGAGTPVRLIVMAGVPERAERSVWINVVLYVLTVISTLFAGSLYGGTDIVADSFWDLLRPSNLMQGLPFAATLLGILTAHEFGHYFAARYHRIAVTLPYFIPMPFGFGTLGAFIAMRQPISDRRKLFDIGVAGPLAGLVLAVPLLIYGLSTSPMIVPPHTPGAMVEGNSIFYFLTKYLIFGKALPNAITGEDVIMNQVTFAAWIGLLVTALNLLPIGQLDGGHTVFAIFGERARTINVVTLAVMAFFAVAGLGAVQRIFPFLEAVGYAGWFLWLALIFFLIGPFHPPALDDVTELDPARKWLGIAVIVIFVLIFVPVPMRPL